MTENTTPGDEPQPPRGHAFVDGRVDEEKLAELLTFPEGSHLEFKSILDLETTEGKVKFAKDVVAMSNTPPGGYILVGVNDAGTPCAPIGHFDRARYDPASLGDIVRSYADGRIELRVKIHENGDSEIAVIFVLPHPDGLPVPMSKEGNYRPADDPDTQKIAFKKGDLPVREGAANVPLRHVHWQKILFEYTRRVRAEGTGIAQELLRAFIEDRASTRDENPTASRTEVPLLVDMDEDTFAQAVQTVLESPAGDVRLRRFLKTTARSITSNADENAFRTALDKWTMFCAQAIYGERTDLVLTAISTLQESYAELGIDAADSRRRLDIVIRLYAVGSMAIRMSAWQVVHALALQPVPSNPFDSQYIYSSWIRHGQVDASRANLIPDNRGGYLISAARELLVEHPAMRPDVGDAEIPAADELAPDDVLLNSLSQFDIAYCLVVAAEGRHNGGYYPSSAALKDYRAAPIAKRIATQPDVRRELLPDLDDSAIAEALADVYSLTQHEASNYRMWWDMPQPVIQFVQQHKSSGTT